MALPPLHSLSALADIPLLCAAIAASPAVRNLLGSAPSHATGTRQGPASAALGDIIAAIYDLLTDTPLAPHAAEIAFMVLSRTSSDGARRPTAH